MEVEEEDAAGSGLRPKMEHGRALGNADDDKKAKQFRSDLGTQQCWHSACSSSARTQQCWRAAVRWRAAVQQYSHAAVLARSSVGTQQCCVVISSDRPRQCCHHHVVYARHHQASLLLMRVTLLGSLDRSRRPRAIRCRRAPSTLVGGSWRCEPRLSRRTGQVSEMR